MGNCNKKDKSAIT